MDWPDAGARVKEPMRHSTAGGSLWLVLEEDGDRRNIIIKRIFRYLKECPLGSRGLRDTLSENVWQDPLRGDRNTGSVGGTLGQ